MNKHYFQILGTLHYSADGQRCKAMRMNTSEGFISEELQFCRPATVLPTNFAAIAAINFFALPCRNIKRMEK